jgi:ABC-2 type transport system permease protein
MAGENRIASTAGGSAAGTICCTGFYTIAEKPDAGGLEYHAPATGQDHDRHDCSLASGAVSPGFLGLLCLWRFENHAAANRSGVSLLLFMAGLSGQVFFGVTAAFTALYMSDDLELLFMAPVPLKVVFAVKSLSVLGSNFLIALLFIFLPGVFCGLFFQAGILFYVLVVFVGIGLWITGTALAELINLVVMRLVPPHRRKEAIGFIGALTGILIALFFQLPNLLLDSQGNLNLGDWLAGQGQMLGIMNVFLGAGVRFHY